MKSSASRNEPGVNASCSAPVELSASTRSQPRAMSARHVGDVVDEVRWCVATESMALEEVRVAQVADEHRRGAVVDGELGRVGTEAAPEETVAADDCECAAHCGSTVDRELGEGRDQRVGVRAVALTPFAASVRPDRAHGMRELDLHAAGGAVDRVARVDPAQPARDRIEVVDHLVVGQRLPQARARTTTARARSRPPTSSAAWSSSWPQ